MSNRSSTATLSNAPARGREKRAARARWTIHLPVYLGLAPFFILLLVFVVAPMIYGLAMSFTDWSVSSRGEVNFVGFENYYYILGGESLTSERFFKSLLNLAIYVPITVAIGLAVALALALVVNNLPDRIYRFLRAAYFVPTVLPLFLCVGIWLWLMNSDSGLIASNLAKVGIASDINWVNTAGWAIVMVVLIDVWHAVGFNFIIFSTGMQDISQDLYDAADLDGANVFQKMTRITIPMLEPIIFFVITYSFISALQVYDIPQILTSGSDPNQVGGPDQVMLFPVMEMVRNVRVGSESGLARAAAEGTVLMVIIMAVTFMIFKLRRKRV
ncbi:carbohydrate ABC transporter permease [Paramicrobacterium agarici]|uniref:carbohydrate ABC transporter permease n=1 Tax=Paramicrobacterium agarici TaxID=630514 RepID=UPI001152EFA6|nr:sugar ABC transporter permease [Microbacterium agarici]TQO22927.1 carbohydrate ABC transporter membrane protein 1 (CUT1 family) [Microbacterium agarici]